ncbi:MAG TPA: hypothetical protein VNY31_05615 [Solirubrobacteraceae bacterium]|nr:hypothetical protein [Solirubrobacteraceae bacterium]
MIVSTVAATRAGWVPGADTAIIATRAHDVLTSHPPLVGQYTLAGEVTGHVTRSLGPMLFWLLALPANYGPTAGLIWTMGAVNTLAIVGAVALARRRGGLVLMFAAALAIALMCQSLAAETFHDVWNPSSGLFGFTLLIFLCWSLACGEYRLLPLTALVASFVVQAHLMYLPPTIGLLAVGLGGLALSRIEIARARKRRAPARTDGDPARAEPSPPPADGEDDRDAPATRGRPVLRWGLATLAVGAICWSAPVIDELSESPGNLTLVAEAATARRSTVGASAGWHAVARAVGIRPWWLYVPSTRWERKYDVRSRPSSHTIVSCLALLGALLLTMLVAFLRRRRDVAAAALIGFVLCAALAAIAASTPTPRVLSATLGYTMWWGSQVGMWVYLILAWSLWLVLAWSAHALAPSVRRRLSGLGEPRQRTLPDRAGSRKRAADSASAVAPALACVVALGAVMAVGGAVASIERPDEHRSAYRPTAALAAHLERVIPAGATVELRGTLDVATLPMKPSLRYFLVRHDVRVLGRGSYLRLGTWYELYDRPFEDIVWVDDGTRSPAPHARLVERVRFRDGFGAQVVSLWVLAVHGHGESAAPRPAASPPAAPQRAATRSAMPRPAPRGA